MPNLRQIRRRIRSVQNTAKITKAMEMVAAAKMRRTQQMAIQGRPYEQKMRQLLGHLTAQRTEGEDLPPLLQQRPVQNIAIVHITTDRGLCGALNANVNRFTSAFLLEQRVPTSLVTIGRKGRDFMARYGQRLSAEFTGLGDRPGVMDISPIVRVIIEDFEAGRADRVYIAYPRLVSTMIQRPVIEPLLPVTPEPWPGAYAGYIYEPDPQTVLAALLPRFVEMEVYHAVLETIASEQSARMVAMRNASENAGEMIRDLTLALNKARQESITKELLDIVGGASALQGS